MNPDRYAQRVIRTAQREGARLGHVLSRDEVLHLRVQTVEPWKRVVLFLLGAGSAWLMELAASNECSVWVVLLPGVAAAWFLYLSIVGRKKPVDRTLETLGDAAVHHVTDIIFAVLDS